MRRHWRCTWKLKAEFAAVRRLSDFDCSLLQSNEIVAMGEWIYD